jgi:hypothetical protein
MESWGLLTGYPHPREAVTEASGRQPGTPVQRRATIAHGDWTSTTQVTAPPLVPIRKTTIGTADEHNN